jgi:mRNA interferase MazF
MEVIGHLTHR